MEYPPQSCTVFYILYKVIRRCEPRGVETVYFLCLFSGKKGFQLDVPTNPSTGVFTPFYKETGTRGFSREREFYHLAKYDALCVRALVKTLKYESIVVSPLPEPHIGRASHSPLWIPPSGPTKFAIYKRTIFPILVNNLEVPWVFSYYLF